MQGNRAPAETKRPALKEAREGAKLTQPQLAEMVKIDQSYYYRIETEGYLPSSRVMVEIARVLGRAPIELFDELKGGAA
jgi:DNA-binding XRE family transcriptional regulator